MKSRTSQLAALHTVPPLDVALGTALPGGGQAIGVAYTVEVKFK